MSVKVYRRVEEFEETRIRGNDMEELFDAIEAFRVEERGRDLDELTWHIEGDVLIFRARLHTTLTEEG